MDTQIINNMSTLITWKYSTVGCGKSKQVHNITKKWVGNKQNASVVGQTNNQTFTIKPYTKLEHIHTCDIWRNIYYKCGKLLLV